MNTFTSARTPFHLSFFGQLLLVLLFNTTIALLIVLLQGTSNFWLSFRLSLVYAQSIGLSIFLLIHLFGYRHRHGPNLLEFIAGIVLGSIVGSLIGDFLAGSQPSLLNDPHILGINVILGIVFGTVIGHFFFASYRIAQGKLELQDQENHQLTAQKQLTETRLRLLQAQIEPHFLFNTLSNIHSLIETDPTQAATVLESLSDYLRVSLRRSREGDTTLGDELALIEAYLSIQRARMGTRLNCRIEVADELRSLPCPPMLVQPLVENAVVHGIEPCVQGGNISVRAQRQDGKLQIEITDDGSGLSRVANGNGMALDNIRARLHALYAEQAGLELHSLEGQGSQALLTLPLEVESVS
jgi:hypothetical protein